MRYIVMILCGLAVACGDDTPPKKDVTDNNFEDVGPDSEQDSDGGNNGEDVGPDADMESPCALVDCIENSECVEIDGLAVCECLSGFENDGELCVPVNVAPSFTNLPGEEVGQRGQADGFVLTATDPNPGDSLSYGILQSTCGFDIQVIANTGAVSWICPANTLTCAATMQVKDDSGLTAEGVLTIQCVRSLPVISSTAPTTAAEAQTLQYAVQCSDPEGGAVTVTKAADDTCGGVMQGNTYVWTPNEQQGGTSCLLKVMCSNGETTESQSSMVTIDETNIMPSITNLPFTQSTLWGRTGTYQVTAQDPDVPTQNLAFSRTSSSCVFPVNVSTTGQISYTCGNSVGTCNSVVRVTDGMDSDSRTFSINCTNTTPSVSAVAISPAQPTSVGQPLTCSYVFSDADGDVDQSTISWLVNGVVSGSGATFSNYGEGQQITCRVTPKDGLASGTPRTSSPVTSPFKLIVEIGSSHMCARTTTGGVRCWGDNYYAKVGGADQSNDAPPYTPMTPTGMGSGVTHLAVGHVGTCAVQSGAAKCWGGGAWGVQGPAQTTSTPTPVTLLSSGVTDIKMGGTHVCALQNGALKCWGGNTHGQVGNTVGNGETFGKNATPTTVTGLSTGVTSFATGYGFTCAIQNGALKCWGLNQSGQLGVTTNIGTNNANPSPIQVPSLTSGVTAVFAGDRFTCAVHNGTLKCWGANSNSQLGRSTTTNTDSTPLAVTVLTGAYSELTPGGESVCYIQNNEMKCWGDNVYGQLNRFTPDTIVNPVSIFGPTVTAIEVSGSNGCAVRNGSLTCWGSNFYGQLGTGVAGEPFVKIGETLINL